MYINAASFYAALSPDCFLSLLSLLCMYFLFVHFAHMSLSDIIFSQILRMYFLFDCLAHMLFYDMLFSLYVFYSLLHIFNHCQTLTSVRYHFIPVNVCLFLENVNNNHAVSFIIQIFWFPVCGILFFYLITDDTIHFRLFLFY